MSAPAIIVYSLDQTVAAHAAADECRVAVLLLSAPGAAASLGASVFHAMTEQAHQLHPTKRRVAALDCGDDAGHALAAIRQGIQTVVFAENCPAREAVADIAGQHGVKLLPGAVYDNSPGHPVLDLVSCPDPLAACRKFLHTGSRTPA